MSAKSTFFSSTDGVFSRIDHRRGHKSSLKFNKTEISRIFSEHKSRELGTNNKMTGKFSSMWKLDNILLNNQMVKDEIKREIKKYLESNENGNKHQNLWYSKSSVKREVYSINGYIFRKRKKEISSKQSNFTSQGSRENINQINRRKETM